MAINVNGKLRIKGVNSGGGVITNPIITFTKQDYGTEEDYISQYLTLKRRQSKGLFNTNEGVDYDDTFMGGVNHLWMIESIKTRFSGNVEINVDGIDINGLLFEIRDPNDGSLYFQDWISNHGFQYNQDGQASIFINLPTIIIPSGVPIMDYLRVYSTNTGEIIDGLFGDINLTVQPFSYQQDNLWNTFNPSTIDINQLVTFFDGMNNQNADWENIPTQQMVPWAQVHNGNPPTMVGKEMIMLDVLDGRFYKIKFLSWTQSNQGGGLSYTRQLIGSPVSTTTTTIAPTTTTTTTSSSSVLTFVKDNYGTQTDVISPSLTLMRRENRGLFNLNEMDVYTDNGGTTHLWMSGFDVPEGSTVTPGDLHSYQKINLWSSFDISTDTTNMVEWGIVTGGNPQNMIDKEMIMLDVNEETYYKIKFLSWTSGNQGGGYSYTRELLFAPTTTTTTTEATTTTTTISYPQFNSSSSDFIDSLTTYTSMGPKGGTNLVADVYLNSTNLSSYRSSNPGQGLEIQKVSVTGGIEGISVGGSFVIEFDSNGSLIGDYTGFMISANIPISSDDIELRIVNTTTNEVLESRSLINGTITGGVLPVDKIYNLSGYVVDVYNNIDNYISNIINTYASNNSLTWDGTKNFVVNGDMMVGKEIYFLDTNGIKHLLNTNMNLPYQLPVIPGSDSSYFFTVVNGVITNIGSMFTLTYVNDYVVPTTTTTTTNPYDLYSYDPIYGVKFAEKLTGTTDWDGTTTIIVEGPLSVGSKAYYLGTDGDKHLITTPNVLIGTGGTASNRIIINGVGGVGDDGSIPAVDGDGSITAVDGTVPYIYTTPFQPQTVKVFKKANYGTGVDVVSQYLTLKRGNNSGLFNTNEGTVYGDTFMGGKNHLWCVGDFWDPTDIIIALRRHGVYDSYTNLWNTFDPSAINISQLVSDYSPLGFGDLIDQNFWGNKPMVPWERVHDGNPLYMLNKEAIMLDVQDQKFYRVKFTQWTSGNAGGGLSYIRQLIV